MALDTIHRIHIAPQGYEHERIFKPAIDNKADKVILLVTEDDDQAAECQQRVEDELEESGIEFESVVCDIFDIAESLETFSELIHQHRDDDVKVNISTGSKITAISGTIACMLNNATPYYVKAEDYGDEAVTRGVEESIQLPAYPIDPPRELFVQVLSFLKENEEDGEPVNIQDLNNYLQEENFEIVEGRDRQEGDNLYDVTRPEIIEPLQERRLIEEISYRGEKRLNLTQKGRRTLEFSKHVIGSDN